MTDEQRIRDLIEASSLGTPDAKAMRERTSPEVVRRVVERAKELSAGGRWVSCRFDWRAHRINDECQDVTEVEP